MVELGGHGKAWGWRLEDAMALAGRTFSPNSTPYTAYTAWGRLLVGPDGEILRNDLATRERIMMDHSSERGTILYQAPTRPEVI